MPLDAVQAANTIGLTAAASAPESAVAKVCGALAALGFELGEVVAAALLAPAFEILSDEATHPRRHGPRRAGLGAGPRDRLGRSGWRADDGTSPPPGARP